MKKKRIVVTSFIAFLLLLAGLLVGLASFPLKPPAHTVEQTIPDDHIPR